MGKKGLRLRGTLLSAASVSVLLTPLLLTASAQAVTGTHFATSGAAYGSYFAAQGNGSAAGSGYSALASLGVECTLPPRTATATAASVHSPVLQSNLGSVTDTVSTTQNAMAGTASVTASASTNAVSLLGGLVTAASSTASATSTDGPGGGTPTASSQFSGLTIDGRAITYNPPPNTAVNLPGVGTLYLNQQTRSGQFIGVSSMMIRVSVPNNTLNIPVGSLIIVSHAYTELSGPVSGSLSGTAYGTSVTGSTTVTSSPSYPAGLSCAGTNGQTQTVTGAGVSNQFLTTGEIVDTARGINTATQLLAQMTASVGHVAVAGVLTADSIKAEATASRTNGQVQLSSAGSGFAALHVTGASVPTNPPPNFTVVLPSGTLILNKQVTSPNGLQVQMVYFRYTDGTTIIAGSAAASAGS